MNYLHCRLVNIAQPVSRQCDCEALLTSSENELAAPGKQTASHVHAHLDVYFCHAKFLKANKLFASDRRQAYPLLRVQVCEGIYLLPWRPPAFFS